MITVYEFQPAPGVKVSQIVNLQDDLALALGKRTKALALEDRSVFQGEDCWLQIVDPPRKV